MVNQFSKWKEMRCEREETVSSRPYLSVQSKQSARAREIVVMQSPKSDNMTTEINKLFSFLPFFCEEKLKW